MKAIFWPFIGKGAKGKPRNVKFGMEHPWAQLLKFRKIQFEGPYEDHVLAIKGPCLGHFWEKGAKGYTQQCEIWQRTSLSKLIMIDEELILRTM